VGKLVAAVVIGVVGLAVGLIVIAAAVLGQGTGGVAGASSGSEGAGGSPGSQGVQPGPAIPSAWVTLYQQAASNCPGLPWSVLAAVGTVETGSGQSSAPGVWSGANGAGAEGPMQFEPSIFTFVVPKRFTT
jgi:hypothetical protein